MLKALLNKYTGNQIICSSPLVLRFFERNPKLAFLNNVTNLAPLMKWSLSIVPLSQMITGSKPPQNIDINQSYSLCATGSIWTYYSTLIQPQNTGTKMLAACNGAMALCHGSNIYRRMKYDKDQEALKTQAQK
ncbi:UPF0041 family protein [Tieghemostelium lacteum]|uniref:Mitochondrial pyruvate carrier n=1 Tax=Tieghemostelium lacteum TaxID=361077 RepID=A0A151ZD04_TIELA|nr:UPF0041 family protein [Tieghemostelium lacteum]|eukprot:KYQ91809.1 UPF0041 family protein [Tieghemostelium lacteum]